MPSIQRRSRLFLAVKVFLSRSPCLIMDLLTMVPHTMDLLISLTATSLHLSNNTGLEWVIAWRDKGLIALYPRIMHLHTWHIDQWCIRICRKVFLKAFPKVTFKAYHKVCHKLCHMVCHQECHRAWFQMVKLEATFLTLATRQLYLQSLQLVFRCLLRNCGYILWWINGGVW